MDRAALRAGASSEPSTGGRAAEARPPRRGQAATRNFLPNISGTGAYGGTQLEMNPNWSLGLAFTWNIFDGGNLVAAYDEAKANLGAANARVKVAGLTLIRTSSRRRSPSRPPRERIQAARVLIASSQENFRLAQGRFDVGVGTILELTDAQLALTQASNTEAQALADYRIALAQLVRAAGRR
jgi:outer membrane protein TolC